ncbi:uncharacterized protein LOC107365572 [Tetranychus urticae]|uniref:Uncharacterized protein n=1 Tax=Tetranychus urticae TaxID=32264 RepID=T1KM23_TETUR|nr:uncharacterized protein LOC107365572 [Tetranychus urticae]
MASLFRRISSQPLIKLLPRSTRLMSTQVLVKVSEQTMDDVSKKLENMVADFKHFAPSPRFFSPDIELNDEILNKNIKGLVNYHFHCFKYMMYINWTYNGFQVNPIDVVKNLDEGVVDIKWQFYGRPGWYMTFFLDLAKSAAKNVDTRRDEWDAFEGLTRFHLDEKGLIYKQDLKLLKSGNYRNIIRLAKSKNQEKNDSQIVKK